MVDSQTAVSLRRQPGSVVNIQNNSASDVYADYNKDILNAAAVGTAPDSWKIAANGGVLSIYPFTGLIWLRCAGPNPVKVVVLP